MRGGAFRSRLRLTGWFQRHSLLRAGVIQVQNAAGQWQPYNLNPYPVTVNGTTYQPTLCGGVNCDPRGLGFNPVVSQLWSKYMPMPNDPQAGDRYNTQGYLTLVPLPLSSNFAVGRIDHDFGSNWRFMTSYRYYKLTQYTTNQVDIGGGSAWRCLRAGLGKDGAATDAFLLGGRAYGRDYAEPGQ